MAALARLISALGDITEYANTGWIHGAHGWANKWKSHQPLPDDLPAIRTKCHCLTPIHYNCLIQHKVTGKLHIVGNFCIKRFGEHRRTCIACFAPNRCQTLRCAACRVYCMRHNTHHDNNINCRLIKKPNENRYLHIVDTMTTLTTLTFGKYKGRTVDDLVGVDDSYLQWLVNDDTDATLKQYIIDSLLTRTKMVFGKQKGVLLTDLEPKYVTWLKANIDKPWIQYI